MYEIKNNYDNQKIIEAFSNSKIKNLMKQATRSFSIINKPLKISLKILNSIIKRLEKQRISSKILLGGKARVIDARSQMLIRVSLMQLAVLRRRVLPACIRSIYYAKQIKKLGPIIIEKELTNGNKKSARNFILAAKLKTNTIKKAFRDLKFAKIRVKKIPRKKIKKKKEGRVKKEKFTLNNIQMNRAQDKLSSIKVNKVKYDYEPLKIALMLGLMYVIFNYVYFKL